ncbi:MAG: hypothetical protein ACXWPM_08745 [Bdellovibrionota bacterium]
MKVTLAKTSEVLTELAKKTGAFALESRDRTVAELRRLKAYLESDDFESHLDQFAAQLDFSFLKVASAPEDALLKSSVRKIRIGIKLKLLIERCSTRVLEASGAGAIAGSVLGPNGAMVGSVGAGSLMVIHYAAIYYGIVVVPRAKPILALT